MIMKVQAKRATRISAAALLTLAAATNADAEEHKSQYDEVEIGQQIFDQLKAKVEVIESSPLYEQLLPVTEPIVKAAQPRYEHPFKFYLVHEAQPNAFATPGGNVYVVDSLLYFVKDREELAAVLCHEVAHTIHHDSQTLMKKQEQILKRSVGIAVLVGPTRARLLALALLGKLQSLGYSREAEAQADLTGSDICAEAGYNPWGMVWLFDDFKNARKGEMPQLLSDHPNDQNRINAVAKHMADNPSKFATFSNDRKAATSFSADKKTPVVFLR